MLLNIPSEIIINHILPYFSLRCIRSLSIVSKDAYLICNNEVWSEMYIRKKKREFYKKEHLISKNNIKNEQDPESSQLIQRRALLIVNTADIPFTIFLVRKRQLNNPGFKKHGIIEPKQTKVIDSYINQRWMFSPFEINGGLERLDCLKSIGEKNDKVYRSYSFLVKEPVNGATLMYIQDGCQPKQVINITIGDKLYTPESSKEIVGINYPLNIMGVTDFKKGFMKIYLKKVKSNISILIASVEKLESDKMKAIDIIEDQKNKIEEYKLKILKDESQIERMNDFIEYVNNM